jgi:hypothetical protein
LKEGRGGKGRKRREERRIAEKRHKLAYLSFDF